MFTAMQDRNWADMINLAARLGGGHVTLQHPEYLETPTLSRTISGADELIALARDDRDVIHAVERIVGQIMLNTARESFGAGFIAFDPTIEDTTTLAILEGLVEGEIFASSRDRGIILGQRLANNLGVEMGDKVIYTMTDRHGDIVSGLSRVSGLVRTGAPSVDGGLSLLPIDAVREVLGYTPDEATQIAVFIREQRQADAVADRLSRSVDDGTTSLPWHVIQNELAGFIAVKVGGARFMELLIAVLVAAGIFNTLFVSVMERLREFGIMVAIGWSPGRLFRLIMLESAWLAVLGLVAAAVVTSGPYYYLASTGLDLSAMLAGQSTGSAGVVMAPVLRVGIYAENVLIIAVAAVLATLLSGLYPAWKAGHVDPVETIRLV
jgi:ABC-type lipoprotein release transport system permease subunit